MTTSDSANPLLADWIVLDPEFGLPPFALIKPEHFRPAFDVAFRSHLSDLQANP
jgi:peptidyl-dipeptidase Dcp